jgi:hypothetical protein
MYVQMICCSITSRCCSRRRHPDHQGPQANKKRGCTSENNCNTVPEMLPLQARIPVRRMCSYGELTHRMPHGSAAYLLHAWE